MPENKRGKSSGRYVITNDLRYPEQGRFEGGCSRRNERGITMLQKRISLLEKNLDRTIRILLVICRIYPWCSGYDGLIFRELGSNSQHNGQVIPDFLFAATSQ